jgi:hypothetical protein
MPSNLPFTTSTNLRRALLVAALGSCFGGKVEAQMVDPTRLPESSGIQNRSLVTTDEDEMSRRDLGEENGFASASEADDDIGQQLILKETPKDRPFRATFDEFALWSNNAANVASGERSDWMWGQRAGVGWQKRIASHWFADVSASQGLYRYRKTGALDFEAMEAMASVLDVEPRFWNVVLVGSFGFTRITNHQFEDSLLNSLSGKFGAQRLIVIDRKNSIQVAMGADWDLTNDVDQVFRDEYSLDLTYKYKIMRDLAVSLAYRMTYFNYREVPRSDLLHVFGATVSYTPKNWMELYATASYALNDSNIDFYDYETASSGVGLGLKLKF